MDKYNNNSKTINNLSMTFDTTDDQLENDICTLIDLNASSSFSNIPSHQTHHQYINREHFNTPSLSNSISLGDLSDMPLVPVVGSNTIPTSYEDKRRLPSYIQLTRNSMDPIVSPYLNYESVSRPQFSHQDLESQGLNGGLVLPDCMPKVFNSDIWKAPSCSDEHLVHGGARRTAEISCVEDPTGKVGKLSVEERKMKIWRYKKKRNERNFSKKIKYACRKTLADIRPRVRGRFAKNDEQGQGGMDRTNGSNHEYDDTDEDFSLYSNFIMPDHQREVHVKEEEDLESSDVFAHLSGLNSFKCSYPI